MKHEEHERRELEAARARVAELEQSCGRLSADLGLFVECNGNQRRQIADLTAEVNALRARLAEFEPRALTCDDEWIVGDDEEDADVVMRFHDYSTVENARASMAHATCRIVRIPIPPAPAPPQEPEPVTKAPLPCGEHRETPEPEDDPDFYLADDPDRPGRLLPYEEDLEDPRIVGYPDMPQEPAKAPEPAAPAPWAPAIGETVVVRIRGLEPGCGHEEGTVGEVVEVDIDDNTAYVRRAGDQIGRWHQFADLAPAPAPAEPAEEKAEAEKWPKTMHLPLEDYDPAAYLTRAPRNMFDAMADAAERLAPTVTVPVEDYGRLRRALRTIAINSVDIGSRQCALDALLGEGGER